MGFPDCQDGLPEKTDIFLKKAYDFVLNLAHEISNTIGITLTPIQWFREVWLLYHTPHD